MALLSNVLVQQGGLAGQALSAFFTTFETAHNACTAGGPALHAQPRVTLTTCGGSLGNGPEQGHPLPPSDRRESSHFTRPARRHYMYKKLGLLRSRSAKSQKGLLDRTRQSPNYSRLTKMPNGKKEKDTVVSLEPTCQHMVCAMKCGGGPTTTS